MKSLLLRQSLLDMRIDREDAIISKILNIFQSGKVSSLGIEEFSTKTREKNISGKGT